MHSTLLRKLMTASLLLIAGSGCSLQHVVVNHVGDAIAQGGGVYASDDDLELIKEATPFSLKLIESLLEESPQHKGLLLAASRGFTQYAFAFVETPASQMEEKDIDAAYAAHERARKLYIRARNYGLRGLEVSYPGFEKNLRKDPEAEVMRLQASDAPLIYWTTASWAAAISLSKDNPRALAEFPLVYRLATRLLQLDESFGKGAIHVLYISLVMNQPLLPMQDRIKSAEKHFDRALKLSGGHQASPFITYAEAVSIPTGNRKEFEQMLDKAGKVDPDAAPQYRLANELYRRRALWLREHGDEYFKG
jgi:predicted anti-sigma-YlaC factor YlaD